MKKKLLILLAFVSILGACNSNENPLIVLSNEDIVGVWNATAFSADIETNFVSNAISFSSKSTSVGKDFDYVYTFSENPNDVVAIGSYTTVTTTYIPGEPESVDELRVNSIDGLDSGSWNLSNGNTITFTSNGETTIAEVIEFTGSKIVLKGFTDEEGTLNGVSYKVKAEILLTLEK